MGRASDSFYCIIYKGLHMECTLELFSYSYYGDGPP
jgi:hypothetical protein